MIATVTHGGTIVIFRGITFRSSYNDKPWRDSIRKSLLTYCNDKLDGTVLDGPGWGTDSNAFTYYCKCANDDLPFPLKLRGDNWEATGMLDKNCDGIMRKTKTPKKPIIAT